MLALHIGAGALGLILGPLAVASETEPPFRSRAGLAYTCASIAPTLVGVPAIEWRVRRLPRWPRIDKPEASRASHP